MRGTSSIDVKHGLEDNARAEAICEKPKICLPTSKNEGLAPAVHGLLSGA